MRGREVRNNNINRVRWSVVVVATLNEKGNTLRQVGGGGCVEKTHARLVFGPAVWRWAGGCTAERDFSACQWPGRGWGTN